MAKKQPSLRLIKATNLALENGGNVSKAMKEAGYSNAMAKNPQKLTQSEGFRDLMNQMGLDAATLVFKVKDGLGADNDGKPDFSVRHKYLETALRLQGLGKAEGGPTSITFINQSQEQRGVYDL